MGIDQRLIQNLIAASDSGTKVEQGLFISLTLSALLGIVEDLQETNGKLDATNEKLDTIVDELEVLKRTMHDYPSLTWLLLNRTKKTISAIIISILLIIAIFVEEVRNYLYDLFNLP